MEKKSLSDHTSHQFNVALEDIRNRVLAMGGLVEQQLADGIRALINVDSLLAETVITGDYKVNAQEVAIDDECVQILARRQPAASDLRLIITVIKTITDLERIGDEAERIASMALNFAKADGDDKRNPHYYVEHLGEQVKHMLHEALDAFARMDAEAALAVWRQDYKADQEYEAITRQLVTYMMENPPSIPKALDVMWSARALGRIGDRSRNICEYVIYLVHGKDVRHTSIEQMEKEVREQSGR
jgi:phosphate transport system protein